MSCLRPRVFRSEADLRNAEKISSRKPAALTRRGRGAKPKLAAPPFAVELDAAPGGHNYAGIQRKGPAAWRSGSVHIVVDIPFRVESPASASFFIGSLW